MPYSILNALPAPQLTIPLFLILIFLSFVTAANSNTSAMAGISMSGISPDNPEAPKYLKILWGLLVMAIAYIMISIVGINGVKIIANFGGMFAIIIMTGATLSLAVLVFKYKKFDKTAS